MNNPPAPEPNRDEIAGHADRLTEQLTARLVDEAKAHADRGEAFTPERFLAWLQRVELDASEAPIEERLGLLIAITGAVHTYLENAYGIEFTSKAL